MTLLIWLAPLSGAALVLSFVFWLSGRELRRAEYIRHYTLPKGLLARLRQRRPALSDAQLQLVARGLQQFFLAYHASGRQFVAMPSQVVDELWHEFILYTRHYQQFCHRAFGGFLHHTPAVVLSARSDDNAGLRRVWRHACEEEKIHPLRPSRLPLLFALDAKLGIADGFHYQADCRALRESGQGGGATHCGGDFSSDSLDGGTAGLGDGPGVGSDGGGDGGSGCGGGCGGGGGGD